MTSDSQQVTNLTNYLKAQEYQEIVYKDALLRIIFQRKRFETQKRKLLLERKFDKLNKMSRFLFKNKKKKTKLKL